MVSSRDSNRSVLCQTSHSPPADRSTPSPLSNFRRAVLSDISPGLTKPPGNERADRELVRTSSILSVYHRATPVLYVAGRHTNHHARDIRYASRYFRRTIESSEYRMFVPDKAPRNRGTPVRPHSNMRPDRCRHTPPALRYAKEAGCVWVPKPMQQKADHPTAESFMPCRCFLRGVLCGPATSMWSSAKWKLGLLGEGKMRFSFFLLQQQTARGVQHARPTCRFKEIPKWISLNNKPNFHFTKLHLCMLFQRPLSKSNHVRYSHSTILNHPAPRSRAD